MVSSSLFCFPSFLIFFGPFHFFIVFFYEDFQWTALFIEEKLRMLTFMSCNIFHYIFLLGVESWPYQIKQNNELIFFLLVADESNFSRIQQFFNYISDLETRYTNISPPSHFLKLLYILQGCFLKLLVMESSKVWETSLHPFESSPPFCMTYPFGSFSIICFSRIISQYTRGNATVVPEFPTKLDWLNSAPLQLRRVINYFLLIILLAISHQDSFTPFFILFYIFLKI